MYGHYFYYRSRILPADLYGHKVLSSVRTARIIRHVCPTVISNASSQKLFKRFRLKLILQPTLNAVDRNQFCLVSFGTTCFKRRSKEKFVTRV